MHAIRPLDARKMTEIALRGQYGPASPGASRSGLPPGERRAGFADPRPSGAAAHVDNWRWAGVPFYLRTGKRLASA